MQKILISILCVFIGFSAFCADENMPTSKSYVDSALMEKQDKISANNGSTQVLMNTGIAGNVGTKNIYDSTASYGGQSDALIDAGTMNAAVQNAIDSEFVCIEWINDDPNDDCLLMEIRGAAPKRSPNLFDVSKIRNTGYITNNGNGSISVNGYARNTTEKLNQIAPDITVGKTYTLSFKTTGTHKFAYLACFGHTSDGTIWRNETSKLITENLLDCAMAFYATEGTTAIISNIQIEEGTVATPYQPYGNIYMPSGN